MADVSYDGGICAGSMTPTPGRSHPASPTLHRVCLSPPLRPARHIPPLFVRFPGFATPLTRSPVRAVPTQLSRAIFACESPVSSLEPDPPANSSPSIPDVPPHSKKHISPQPLVKIQSAVSIKRALPSPQSPNPTLLLLSLHDTFPSLPSPFPSSPFPRFRLNYSFPLLSSAHSPSAIPFTHSFLHIVLS